MLVPDHWGRLQLEEETEPISPIQSEGIKIGRLQIEVSLVTLGYFRE